MSKPSRLGISKSLLSNMLLIAIIVVTAVGASYLTSLENRISNPTQPITTTQSQTQTIAQIQTLTIEGSSTVTQYSTFTQTATTTLTQASVLTITKSQFETYATTTTETIIAKPQLPSI